MSSKVENVSKPVQFQESNDVRATNLAAEFLPRRTASETFAMAAEAEPTHNFRPLQRMCSIWKS